MRVQQPDNISGTTASTDTKRFSRLRIGRINVDRVTLAELLDEVAGALETRSRRTVFYANAYAITSAQKNDELATAFDCSDLVFCDGFGVYAASRWLGAPVPERFAWPDWIDRLAELCVTHGASMFFVGAAHGVADRAIEVLRRRHPALVAFAHHGYFPKTGPESDSVIHTINDSRAAILLVGFGMPAQELWITHNRSRLKPLVVMAVGATFDYVSGNVVRGPRWMTDHGFEWLSRLVIEPRRLWRRYLLGLPAFAFAVMKQLATQRDAVRSTAAR